MPATATTLRFALALSVAVLLVGTADAAARGWTWPVAGEVLEPYRYGLDRFAPGQHRGIDVRAEIGAPVVAARAGTVRFTGAVGSSGLTVTVRTVDGRLDTSYLHLESATVAAGDRVATGQRIGSVGGSGSPSNPRPHLHFGIRAAGTRSAYRDPLAFLPAVPLARGRRPGEPPGATPVPVRPRPVRFASRPAPAVGRHLPDLGWALACLASIALAVVVGRSSIGDSCRTTSQPRSTTSTASPTWATSTRR